MGARGVAEGSFRVWLLPCVHTLGARGGSFRPYAGAALSRSKSMREKR